MPQITVPDLVGLERSKAEEALTSAGLAVGAVRSVSNFTTPQGIVTNSSPVAGTPVPSGSTVNIDVSSGPEQQVPVPDVVDRVERLPDKPIILSSHISVILFSAMSIVVVILIAFIIIFPWGHKFLEKIAEPAVARGLITFLFALSTVAIAIILAISTVIFPGEPEGDKHFDRGKQVLSVLIGVLGTIVGFYFAVANPPAPNPNTPAVANPNTPAAANPNTLAAANPNTPTQITTSILPDGVQNQPYIAVLQSTGLTTPLSWSVTPRLPSGLVLEEATGIISGTPISTFQRQGFSFSVTDTNHLHADRNLYFQIKQNRRLIRRAKVIR